MALSRGARLGPYEITDALGTGGMGEVYKARDTRLDRTVAIKVLPEAFAADAQFRDRFDREARAISQLDHPHICALYDVGEQDGAAFLVMQYLEGETLADRLEKGALPLDRALKIAIEIASALDNAHRAGITHRDLKPGNVMLTKTGAKLLDFGLAKTTTPVAVSGTMAPTRAPNLTAQGTILGTFQYMAPEQLEGKEADVRTDIFAFGVVLYEMLTGQKAFQGKSQPQLIAAIITAHPDPISKTQSTVPPALDFLVKRCLAKNPEERLQTATDLVAELRWIAGGGADGVVPAPVAVDRRHRAKIAQVALAIVTLLVVAMSTLVFVFPRGAAARVETRFLITVPDMPVAEAVSISPDGRQVAYSANDGGTSAVFVRPLNAEVAQRLAGTDGAGRLFWSRDSKWIAFFSAGKLKKVEAAGGPPQNICETPDILGGTWNADGVIVFASSKGLQRVLAAGGEPSPIATTGDSQREPFFLPDGRHYLYLSGKESAAAICAGLLDSKDATRLLTAQSSAVYAEPGYLLYHREGTLYAQPFNANKLALKGEAIRLADKLAVGANGAAPFAASDTNVLLYRNDLQQVASARGAAGGNNIPDQPLRWVDRTGNGEQAGAPGGWIGPDISPDGKRSAIHRHDGDGGDLWIFAAGQNTPSRFTFEAAQDNSAPIWSPDGSRIAFGSRRNGKWGLYVKLADNTRIEELVINSDLPAMPMSWSGDRLVYWISDPKTAGDIWAVSLTGAKKQVPILQTRADERNPQVSADGKWIAYSSNETGRSEIFIRPFPVGPGKIQVSVNGGVFPRWRRDGKELYFMSLVALGSMMASDIRVSGASVDREAPRLLFQSVYLGAAHSGGEYHAYSVSADGQRFLIPQFESVAARFGRGVRPAGAVAAALTAVLADRHAAGAPTSQSTAPITVVLDWTAALETVKR